MTSNRDNFKGEIRKGILLSDYTSLGIGGRAELLAIPEDLNSLNVLLASIREAGTDYFIIGGGTNLLVRDEGLDSVVISLKEFRKVEITGVGGQDIRDDGESATLFVQAGLPLPKLLSFCVRNNLSGPEGLAGIPGNVGGAVFGNAGANGREIMDLVEKVTVLDQGSVKVISRDKIESSYRNGGFSDETIVLGVHLTLRKDESGGVKRRIKDFLLRRKALQPVGERTAGCVFRNPADESAGRLIDLAGCKGMSVGGVEVSALHAGFFLNKGGGTADDFLRLMDVVCGKVKEMSGILLEPEIRIIGRVAVT